MRTLPPPSTQLTAAHRQPLGSARLSLGPCYRPSPRLFALSKHLRLLDLVVLLSTDTHLVPFRLFLIAVLPRSSCDQPYARASVPKYQHVRTAGLILTPGHERLEVDLIDVALAASRLTSSKRLFRASRRSVPACAPAVARSGHACGRVVSPDDFQA